MLRPESRCVRPQALPLRSHHFQKVGKKPELTLVWEPEDLEQEPVRQVRAGGQGRFSRPALCPGPPPSSGWALPLPPCASPPAPDPRTWAAWWESSLYMPRPAMAHPHRLLWAAAFRYHLPPLGHPLWGEVGGSAYPSKSRFLTFGVLLRMIKAMDLLPQEILSKRVFTCSSADGPSPGSFPDPERSPRTRFRAHRALAL